MYSDDFKLGVRGRYILIYTVMVALTTTILILLHEVRIDVYISLYILEYYIIRAIISPASTELTLSYLKFIDYLFLVVFIIIVAYRIINILFPEMLRWLHW